jgi:hypothetical protein
MTKYLEIAPDSHLYVEIPSNLCRSLCINNKVLVDKNYLFDPDFTFLDMEDFDKIAIWQFNSDFIFDDSAIVRVLKNLGIKEKVLNLQI